MVGSKNAFVLWLRKLSPEVVSIEIPTAHSEKKWSAFLEQAAKGGFTPGEVIEHLKQLNKDGEINKRGSKFYFD